MARVNNPSAIGLALAGKSASVDIPSPHARRDSLTAVTTSSASKKKQAGILPTPPNSISPDLPPHRHLATQPLRVPGTSPNLESDIDLHDENTPQAQRNALNAEALDSLGDLDSAGAITPGMLGKHHLPEILLNHGPLAIRHIMGHLTTSVPGFSRISSAKARRLVVAALEGRGSGLEGGTDTDVIFDKVGWGRWDARLKGQPPRERANVTPPRSLPSSYSHPYSQPSGSEHYGSSVPRSAGLSHSEQEYEDHDMLEHEADKMSLDGNQDGYASSEAPEPMMDIDLGEGDVTDEEDWASMGAAALRARSLPTSGRAPGGGHLYQPVASYSRQRSYTPAVPPMPNIAQSVSVTKQIPPTNSGFTLPSGAGVDDSQERAAIEALLSLGSL
jgi:hypothetical protein